MKIKNFAQRHPTVRGAGLLFFAMMLTKFIGAVLKIPLTGLIGGLGMGYFSTAGGLFAPVYSLTTAGLPLVVTRVVAGYAHCGKYGGAVLLRRRALRLAAVLGVCGSLLIAALAAPFCFFIAKSPDSLPSVFAIAPALLFCCISAVYRSYHEGLSDMTPTAVSQVLEAAVKTVLGLTLAFLFAHKGAPAAAAAATCGITMSELACLLYLRARTAKNKHAVSSGTCEIPASRELLRQSMPLTAAALAGCIGGLTDLLTIPSGISKAVAAHSGWYSAYFLPYVTPGVTAGHLGDFIYGSYTGITLSLFAVIPSLSFLLCRSALPSVAAAYSVGDVPRLKKILASLLRWAAIITVPLGTLFALTAQTVLSLLYPTRPAESAVSLLPLVILSCGALLPAMSNVFFSVYSVTQQSRAQIVTLLIFAAVKLPLNLLLVPVPGFHAAGAAAATIIGYAAALLYSCFTFNKKYIIC